MSDPQAPDRLGQLADRLRGFAADRDWERFHTPKNLATAVAGEAGELAAEFQWLTDQESVATVDAADPRRPEIEAEIADVLIYLVRLADVLGVDLIDVAHEKVSVNERRFPRQTSLD